MRAMVKSFSILSLFLALLGFVVPTSANADMIKLKNGQTHAGVVTAEEEERVQIKLEGTNVRVWFSRDQIATLEKATPEEGSQPKDDPSASGASAEELDEDVIRARELLEKMREQSKNKAQKEVKKKPPPKAAPARPAARPAPDPDKVARQINLLRRGSFYKQLDACRALGKMGANEAIPDLIQALDHEDPTLRSAANDALIQITEKDFGFKAGVPRSVRLEAIKRWDDWYEDKQKEAAKETLKSTLW